MGNNTVKKHSKVKTEERFNLLPKFVRLIPLINDWIMGTTGIVPMFTWQ